MKRVVNYMFPSDWPWLLAELAVATLVCLFPILYTGSLNAFSLKLGVLFSTMLLVSGEIVRQSLGVPRIVQYFRDIRNAFQGLVELRALNTYSKLIQIHSEVERLAGEIFALRQQHSLLVPNLATIFGDVSSVMESFRSTRELSESYRHDFGKVRRSLEHLTSQMDTLYGHQRNLADQFSSARSEFDVHLANGQKTRDSIFESGLLRSTVNSQILQTLDALQQEIANLNLRVDALSEITEKALQSRHERLLTGVRSELTGTLVPSSEYFLRKGIGEPLFGALDEHILATHNDALLRSYAALVSAHTLKTTFPEHRKFPQPGMLPSADELWSRILKLMTQAPRRARDEQAEEILEQIIETLRAEVR